MNSGVDGNNIVLAFLALFETTGRDGYLGAILVTDPQGVPQEFRCTYPVRPTGIQKPLYGDTLGPYIGVELCGRPLLESIKSKPALVLVQREFLLDLRLTYSAPVVFARRAGEAIEVSPVAGTDHGVNKVRLDCESGRFQPLIVYPHPKYVDDLEFARGALEGVFGHLDPLEPFERMQKAIEVLGKQDARFQ